MSRSDQAPGHFEDVESACLVPCCEQLVLEGESVACEELHRGQLGVGGFQHDGGAERGVGEVPCHDVSYGSVVWVRVKVRVWLRTLLLIEMLSLLFVSPLQLRGGY